FCDENLDQTRAKRNLVISATPNEHVAHKKFQNAKVKFKINTNDKNTENQEGEHQVESFQTLLSNLATICKNDCRIASERNITFDNITLPTKFQETLLNAIQAITIPKVPK
ncbi:MAG: hypothetical protein LBJ67_03765, partial [Planctomycetaceae bacterium]|nr:hypothetical protein [Planctomycetaceae bacterium]